MNSLTKNLAELGTKMKTGTENLKQKGGELTAKAGAAIVDAAKAIDKNIEGHLEKDIDDPTGDAAALAVPSVVEAVANDESGELDSLSPSKQRHGVQNVQNSLRGFASQFKRPEEPLEISDLLHLLARLFEVNPAAKKPHEMVEALDIQGIHTWRGFLLMAEEDIPMLTKNSREGPIPISQNSIRMLTYLKQFTLHNIDKGVPTAKDPEMYTQESFDAYVEDLQMGRKSALSKEELEEANKPSRIKNVRAGISGFASKFKPGTKMEEGSIGDILSKTKAKVLNRKGGDKGSLPSDDISVGAASSASVGSTELASVPGDITFEVMQKNVDDLASKLEDTAKNVSNKEEVQKLMVPLLSKLKKSQDRFGAMIESRKKKKAEKEAEKASATTEDGAEAESEEKKKKLKNLLNSAENATKRAFENAEKVARQAARKAGILDNEKETEAPKDEPEAVAPAPAAPPPAIPEAASPAVDATAPAVSEDEPKA